MSNAGNETKVRAIGNSAGIILPSEMLNKLALERGDKLFLVETDKGSFKLTPYDQECERYFRDC